MSLLLATRNFLACEFDTNEDNIVNKIAKRTNAKELRRAMCNEIVYWRASEREREKALGDQGKKKKDGDKTGQVKSENEK